MIRRCQVTDIPWMLNLGQKMHEESRYRSNRLNLAKVEHTLRTLIASPFGLVLRSENGFIFGIISTYWFSDDLYAVDYVLYVEPEGRKGGQAGELVEAFIAEAKVLGVEPKDIMIENSTDTENPLIEKLYASLGLRRVGGVWIPKE